nr:PREDICTED: uncharacterized protein LOC103364853 [Stegastes partitus]
MGVEDWENKYKRLSKPQLRDFLDDEEDSVIFRMGRPYPEPSATPIRQNTKRSGFLPAPYPEGYDTIDRRRKKKITDPGVFLSTEADKYREETFPSDLAVLREKRGELFMRQVAEMQEEEERMTSCLRPYKNGLLYKTRMWAKTELDNTLENYVAYKKEQDARMRARFDFEFESSQDLHYPTEAEEDIDGIAFMGEDFHSENTTHYKDRYSFSYEGHVDNSQGLREKKSAKSKTGGWVSEAMLSPVEEPSDEYVDPMDELQVALEQTLLERTKIQHQRILEESPNHTLLLIRGPPPVAVYPVFRTTEEPQLDKPVVDPSLTAPTPGGSILGGMFGGGATPKPAGPQSGGSLLGGVFGGAGGTPQPGGSLLGGMFGGAPAGSQTGSSILGGIGGSLFGGMGQPPRPSDSVPAQPKSASGTPSQSQIRNEKVSPKVPPSRCGTNKTGDSKLPENQQKF